MPAKPCCSLGESLPTVFQPGRGPDQARGNSPRQLHLECKNLPRCRQAGLPPWLGKVPSAPEQRSGPTGRANSGRHLPVNPAMLLRVTQPSTALSVQGSQADAATTAGCALPSASLPADFTQLQPRLAMLKYTISLIISPARKVKRILMETNNAPMSHFVSKLIVIQPGKEVG